jgi:hypothetical protein
MGSTVTTEIVKKKTWGGGNEPMGTSYGKCDVVLSYQMP